MPTENNSERPRFSNSTKLVSNAITYANKMLEHALKIEKGEIENDWYGNSEFWTNSLASLRKDLEHCTEE